MKIGLIDVDSHNFPSLPLMKLSAYHKARGHDVEFCKKKKHYDIVYKSKVFTFTPDINYMPKADQVIEGGTGYESPVVLPKEIENICPDYNLYPQYDEAYGFITRGCPRNCPYCVVTQKEGPISKQVAEVREFLGGQGTIKLLDPNLLACKDREKILIQLAETGAWVDFTQGLDIRLVDKGIVQLLNNIKIKIAHFAWDNEKEDLTAQFKLFRKHTNINDFRRRTVYILTNYTSSHADDLGRVYALRDMGFNPYVMIYDKDNAPYETRLLQRWINNRRIFGNITTFEEYDRKRG